MYSSHFLILIYLPPDSMHVKNKLEHCLKYEELEEELIFTHGLQLLFHTTWL